jgi:ankyrin repeat protein
MNAAASGNKILVENILTAGADINAQATGTTTLISAIGNIELLKFLLEQKANPNLASGNAQTPLEYAARSSNIEIVRILLEAGARTDIEAVGRDTPLHSAAANGSAEIVQLLLSKGADVNARGQGGRTALHALVTPPRPNDTRRVTIAKLIIESGGKIDALNSQGQTPLTLAQQMGNNELIELFSPRVQPKRPGIITPAPYPGRPPAAR